MIDALTEAKFDPVAALAIFQEKVKSVAGPAIKITQAILSRLFQPDKQTFESLVYGLKDGLGLTELGDDILPAILGKVNAIKAAFDFSPEDLKAIADEPRLADLRVKYPLLAQYPLLPAEFGSIGGIQVDAGIAQYNPSGTFTIEPWLDIPTKKFKFPPEKIERCDGAIKIEQLEGKTPDFAKMSCTQKVIDVKQPPNWTPYLRLRFN